ncbi:hypothetical protein FGG08_001811 [Glutinoglossum americanum]|uniref:Succinate dehydrogenase assembly factor 4, mitochondrial n=1 Tax=Glutinoglossum americanum TaxID=1670608 RepID=A0A9P8L609_9PEZI|nr:hypothetical protein FGG08_001811 [Glutinoglossum americanum]
MPPSLSRTLFGGNTRHLFLSTASRRTIISKSNSFSPQPSPPRLPPEEQAVFERLQEASTGAFSTPKTKTDTAPPPNGAGGVTETVLNAQLETGQGEELHPDARRGAKPEFEGEVNPKTGEVGGPKNEPLRWGGGGDWSYNGRVTDF